MNSKELVRNMIAFLNERHDMDCVTSAFCSMLWYE